MDLSAVGGIPVHTKSQGHIPPVFIGIRTPEARQEPSQERLELGAVVPCRRRRPTASRLRLRRRAPQKVPPPSFSTVCSRPKQRRRVSGASHRPQRNMKM
ncbi:hypothetical protein BV898_19689 [Hypsibius exemplaris]|uniref:Uncharacterized protein n=1 Tax=Hypsibius exemplaris TaxID=2072580 RepID=A0A9X6NM26_HYPEX|nr:hypothetical protein BV898_19689 [Hypsibius exemplaris]